MGFIKKIIRAIINFFSPPDPIELQYNAACKASKQYTSSLNPEDLKTAITAFDSALQLCRNRVDKTHHLLAPILVNYATALWSRYKLDRDTDTSSRYGHLQEIIRLDEEAHTLWKDGAPPGEAYSTLLTNLANAYSDRASLAPAVGATHSYDESLALNREVYDYHDYPVAIRITAAYGIGRALWASYDRSSPRRELLDEAIIKLKEALGFFREHQDAESAAICVHHLAQAHDTRFGLSKQVDDLSEAIGYNEAARNAHLAGSPHHASCLHNLALELLRRYDIQKDRKDLDEAKAVAVEGKTAVVDPAFLPKFEEVLNLVRNREQQAVGAFNM